MRGHLRAVVTGERHTKISEKLHFSKHKHPCNSANGSTYSQLANNRGAQRRYTLRSPSSHPTPLGKMNTTNHSGVTTDHELVELWLLSKDSTRTRTEYRREHVRFSSLVGVVPLAELNFKHLMTFKEKLNTYKQNNGKPLSASTVARAITALKSLLNFAQQVGYTTNNIGEILKAPSVTSHLAERILTENEVAQLFAHAGSLRNNLMLRLLYSTGLRVSELVALQWSDLTFKSSAAVVRVNRGKGNKSRSVIIPEQLGQELLKLRSKAPADAPIFVSRSRSADGTRFLSAVQVNRIIKDSAKRAGLEQKVSAHFFRHSHASHSLERGASLALVAQTLGHSNVATTSAYLHAMPNTSSSTYLSA